MFSPLLPILKWVLIGILIVYFFFSDSKRKRKMPDIKMRMLRKFQYVHAELFPQLADHEKREMFNVLSTTVHNASLFKDKDKSHKVNESTKKKSNKRVSFHNDLVSHRHYY